jgi:hypothetical protein
MVDDPGHDRLRVGAFRDDRRPLDDATAGWMCSRKPGHERSDRVVVHTPSVVDHKRPPRASHDRRGFVRAAWIHTPSVFVELHVEVHPGEVVPRKRAQRSDVRGDAAEVESLRFAGVEHPGAG